MTPQSLPTLPINWFDFAVLGALIVGMIRGRKRGMSEELLDLVMVLLMVYVAGTFYRPLGVFLSGFTGFPPLVTNCSAYATILIGIKIVFFTIKRFSGEKAVGSDTFGRLEYYLGMLAGMVRWAGYAVLTLAFLHAPLITDAEYEAKVKADRELYGDNFFTIFSLGFYQKSVFRDSYLGPKLNPYLEPLLIEASPIGDIMTKREGWGKQRENEIDSLNRPRR